MKRPTDFAWEHDPHVYHNCGLTGYTGVDPHAVMQLSILPAARVQIGPRGLYKGALAVLPGGDLVAVVCDYMCYALKTSGRRWEIHMLRSPDGGYTWEEFEYSPTLYGKEPGLTGLKNGALLLTLENEEHAVTWSDDDGRSWHVTNMPLPPECPAEDHWRMATVRTPIEHPDGTVSLLRCVGHSGRFRDGAPPSCLWFYHSPDGGKTWPEHEELETWDDAYTIFDEADFLRLPDDRILATSRFEWEHPIAGTQPPWPAMSVRNDHAAGHMVLMESSDEGRTWTPPRDFLNYSEVQGQLTLLNDGRILCTYTSYHLPFGVAAVLSDDLGKTWDLAHPYQLAISNSVSTGWPTTRQLADGTLLTVYALEPYHLEPDENGRVVFQCVRWQVPRRQK